MGNFFEAATHSMAFFSSFLIFYLKKNRQKKGFWTLFARFRRPKITNVSPYSMFPPKLLPGGFFLFCFVFNFVIGINLEFFSKNLAKLIEFRL